MPEKLLELKNDLVFQKIFGLPKNSEITAHFLSLILNKQIHNLDLDVNKRLLRYRSDAKTGRLDIRAKFNNGEDCNIELQVLPYKHMPSRMLEYWACMYDNKISIGKDYNVLKPSISILIADYCLDELKDIGKYHTVWNLREKDFPKKIISNDIELHILEIPKIKNEEMLGDELSQWLKFIQNPVNEEVEKFMSENQFLKQAKEELAHLSDDPDFQLLVRSRAGMLMDIYCFKKQAAEEGREEGHKKGLEEGRAEGLAEGHKEGHKEGFKEGLGEGEQKGKLESKREIAKKLKQKHIPIDEIIEITELSKEEIENL